MGNSAFEHWPNTVECAGMLMMVQGSGDFTSWFAIQLVRMFVDSHIGVEYSMTERMVGEGDITITPAGARYATKVQL